MREATRNRLLGGIVLGSLLVLGIPMLFDGPGIERNTVPAPAAPEPLTALHELALAFDPEGPDWTFVEDARSMEQGHLQVRPEYRSGVVLPLPGSGPSLDARGLPAGWALRVATLGERQAARDLRDALLGDGYNAHVESSAEDHQVLVGPLIDPDRVRELEAALTLRQGQPPELVGFQLPEPGPAR